MRRAVLLLLTGLGLAGCATTAPVATQSESLHPWAGVRPMPPANAFEGRSTAVHTGKASWYSKGAHGRPTANGETYNHWDWTCAHRTYPLGSFVSRSAAIHLDMMKRGVVPVRVERLKLKPEFCGVYQESLPYQRRRPVPMLAGAPPSAVRPVTMRFEPTMVTARR
jgi:rare lipoprotein A (peptidoglycan hydrolase)